MNKQPITIKRVFGLDLMRASAILLVLISHSIGLFKLEDGILVQTFSVFGYYGVEIFFVLSGFLIGKILFQLFVNKEVVTKKDVILFLKRRWYRTFPNYFLILLINILISIYFNQEFFSLWKYFFFLQNFCNTMLPFFPESWSLSIEEFAYIILPITLFFVFKKIKNINKSNLILYVLLVLIASITLFRYYYNFTTTNTTQSQWNLSLKAVVIYRLDSIFIGVVFCWIHLNYAQIWKKFRLLFAFLGCVMVFVPLILISNFGFSIERQPFFWNALYIPLTSFTCAFFLPLMSDLQTDISIIKNPITFISKISYSIYLIHYSIVLQTFMYFIDSKKHSNFQLIIFTFFYFFVVISLSALVYCFYEKPLTDKRELIK